MEDRNTKVNLIRPLCDIIESNSYDLSTFLHNATNFSTILAEINLKLNALEPMKVKIANINTELANNKNGLDKEGLDIANGNEKLSKDFQDFKSEIGVDVRLNKSKIDTNVTKIESNSEELAALKLLVVSLSEKVRTLEEECSNSRARETETINTVVQSHMDKQTVPFILRAKINAKDKMLTIRGLPQD